MRLPFVLAVAVLAAGPVNAQMVTIPFGGPKKERPSPNIWLRGSPAGIAAAVAMRSRPPAMTDLDESRHPVELLQYFGLSIGSRVLDVMAGSGYYSEIIGVAVGSGGKVTALIPPAAMKDQSERMAIIGVVGRVPNVSILTASQATVQFNANSFDFVLMHLAYHDLYRADAAHGAVDPAGFLRKIFAALRPGGIVGVVDHVAAPGGDTGVIVRKLQRIDPATVKADFVRAGFVFDGESDLLRKTDDDHSEATSDAAIDGDTDRFVFRFRKPE